MRRTKKKSVRVCANTIAVVSSIGTIALCRVLFLESYFSSLIIVCRCAMSWICHSRTLWIIHNSQNVFICVFLARNILVSGYGMDPREKMAQNYTCRPSRSMWTCLNKEFAILECSSGWFTDFGWFFCIGVVWSFSFRMLVDNSWIKIND